MLNKINKRVKLLLKDFKECLKLTFEEGKTPIRQGAEMGIAYAKS